MVFVFVEMCVGCVA